MEYSVTTEPILLREYGRGIQNMVALLMEEPDKAKRTRMANQTIKAMSIVAPDSKDMDNYEQKLWEHLQRLSGYKLDVDTPFELPEKPAPNAATDPEKMVGYYPHHSKYRQYGKVVEMMIHKVVEMEEGEAKEKYILDLANYMKHSMQVHAGTQPSDKVVLNHLRELSEGKIDLDHEKVQLRHGLLPNRFNINNASAPAHVRKSKKKTNNKARSKGKRKRPR